MPFFGAFVCFAQSRMIRSTGTGLVCVAGNAIAIDPCAMPAVKAEDDKSEAQIWDMVNFVQALPYREMLPDEVREKVYPEHHGDDKKVVER